MVLNRIQFDLSLIRGTELARVVRITRQLIRSSSIRFEYHSPRWYHRNRISSVQFTFTLPVKLNWFELIRFYVLVQAVSNSNLGRLMCIDIEGPQLSTAEFDQVLDTYKEQNQKCLMSLTLSKTTTCSSNVKCTLNGTCSQNK